MRKVYLIVLLLLFGLYSLVAQKIWNGGAAGNWNNISNWLPAGVPIAGDDVIFNSAATTIIVTIDAGISPVSINSLHFINNSDVIFQCSVTSNFRLFSTLIMNPALLVEAGSVFTFDAINTGTNNSTLDMTVATGCIGTISGTLNISCTGGANSGPKLDTYSSATNYGIVTVTNGGKIRILPNADNTITSTNLTPVPTLIMQSGSMYENLKNGGSFPAGTWFATSLARALSTGSTGPSFTGANYGNLEWNCPSQTVASFLTRSVSFNNVNLINTNPGAANGEFRVRTGTATGIYTMTINGNLDVGIDARLVTSSPTVPFGANGGYISVKGNVNNRGTITSNGIPGTFNEFLISGTTPQFFSNYSTGVFSGSNLLFTMQNPAGLTLLTPLTLPWNADFISGKIFTTSTSILTMLDNAVTANNSINSFVEGPMKKIGDDDFIFPVGVGSIYAPVGIISISGQNTSDVFTAEYKRINPQSIHGATVQAGMNHISYVEYWALTQNTGTAVKKISLAVTPTSFCKILNSTYVSRWNGSFWTTESSTNTGITFIGSYQTGTITSFNNLSSFGDFSLITDLSVAINPLPVKLVNFNVRKISSVKSAISWELAECCSAKARFEIQKSNSSNIFTSIAQLSGNETNRFYSINDTLLDAGLTNYRLKIIEENGEIYYSKIIVVINGTKGLLVTSITPNPVQDRAVITISAAKQSRAFFSIYNLAGSMVKQWQSDLVTGTTNTGIDLTELPNGVYYLLVSGTEGKTVFRFMKH